MHAVTGAAQSHSARQRSRVLCECFPWSANELMKAGLTKLVMDDFGRQANEYILDGNMVLLKGRADSWGLAPLAPVTISLLFPPFRPPMNVAPIIDNRAQLSACNHIRHPIRFASLSIAVPFTHPSPRAALCPAFSSNGVSFKTRNRHN
jgi:hypothetical protein